MHHMRVALDHHQLRHMHRAVLADAPQVVASQIDQHDMLGAFLLIGEQLLCQSLVFLLAVAARARARYRAGDGFAPLHRHQHLRRCPDEGHVVHP
jgi:hypothetical protein